MLYFYSLFVTQVQFLLLPAALSLLGNKTTLMSPEVVIASGIPCCRYFFFPLFITSVIHLNVNSVKVFFLAMIKVVRLRCCEPHLCFIFLLFFLDVLLTSTLVCFLG